MPWPMCSGQRTTCVGSFFYFVGFRVLSQVVSFGSKYLYLLNNFTGLWRKKSETLEKNFILPRILFISSNGRICCG